MGIAILRFGFGSWNVRMLRPPWEPFKPLVPAKAFGGDVGGDKAPIRLEAGSVKSAMLRGLRPCEPALGGSFGDSDGGDVG
jgi:hypothetical protein